MPSSTPDSYWVERRLELLRQMEIDEAELQKRLTKLYEAEAKDLKKEIASYYQEYGEKNVIEYRKLLFSLSDEDRSLLMRKMDEFAKKYPQYAHLMPVRESIYRLDRLEGLRYSLMLRMLEIGAIENDELTKHLTEYARLAANLAAEDMGFGSTFYVYDSSIVQATVGAKWAQGKNFSERIWEDREKLANRLSDEFAKRIARGENYRSIAKDLSEIFVNTSKRDIYRLVYTEGSFIFNEAQRRVHEQYFDYFRISTVTDGKACKICRSLEEEQEKHPVRYKDAQVGINDPPIHPWCRCTTYPVPSEGGDTEEGWQEWMAKEAAKRGGYYPGGNK